MNSTPNAHGAKPGVIPLSDADSDPTPATYAPGRILTAAEIRDARRTLGIRWGLNVPLSMSQMARLVRLGGKNGSDTVRKWEEGRSDRPVSGPVSLAVELMLDGAEPADLQEILRMPAERPAGGHKSG